MCHTVNVPTIVPLLLLAQLTEHSATHRTLQSSVTAAGRFYPYIQLIHLNIPYSISPINGTEWI
jgi:hypothetical protein